MIINTLPPSAVRAIGASQVLNDPAAVVKELLDNALDARASSITVEIASNTLDFIHVRDNGHGIPPQDRQLVARPHCTSKISDEDDLKLIGGRSLGFRGEALASMAEMSGSLNVSTRVEGEQVATTLKIDRHGNVTGQEKTSLPVGTTVKIADFIKANPVRRKVVLKHAEKGLLKIKHCLKSYAFARPHVRLSLRVLQAKNDKSNWTYAPKSDGNAEDVAFKIVGAACVSQCIWSVIEDQGFTLQAFLPRADSEVSKISSTGSFISIDARPVSTARGTSKQIVKAFREALKKANPEFEGVKEPFLYLEISCPIGSYDANVEPAKDDVLLESPDIVIDAARRLFLAVYPLPQTEILREAASEEPNSFPEDFMLLEDDLALLDGDDFITSLETQSKSTAGLKPSRPPPVQLITDDIAQYLLDQEITVETGRDTENHRPAFRHNMYGCDEEDIGLFDARPPSGGTEADLEELRQARNDVNVSNPWVIAKMNAPLPQRSSEQENVEVEPSEYMGPYNPPIVPYRSEVDPANFGAFCLPTPRPSSPAPHISEPISSSDQALDHLCDRDGRAIGSASLPPGQMIIQPGYARSPPSLQHASGTPLRSIPDISNRSGRPPRRNLQQTKVNKPFKLPVKDPAPKERVWFDHLEHLNQGSQRASRTRPQANSSANGLIRQGELGDLVEDSRLLTPPRRNKDMRDFMAPMKRATDEWDTSVIGSMQSAQHRRASPAPSTEPQKTAYDDENTDTRDLAMQSIPLLSTKEATRPSKRRKTSKTRALRELSGNVTVAADEDGDYNTTPVRRRSSHRRRRTTDGKKATRRKSLQIPLERVADGQEMRAVKVDFAITKNSLSAFAERIDTQRSFLDFGKTAEEASGGFPTALELGEVKAIAANLYQLLIERFSEAEMAQDLSVLLQNAFAAHAERSVEGKVA